MVKNMKSINFVWILIVTLPAIILIGIAGCGGSEAETIVQITEPPNNISINQKTIHILGKVENTNTTIAKIAVNGEEWQVNIINGLFEANIMLLDGNNIVKVFVDGVSAQINITKIKQTIGENEIIGKDNVPMVLIQSGVYYLDDAFNPDLHRWVGSFYIDKYEITNAQYKKFMDATGHHKPYYWDDRNFNAPNQPVIGVSWDDANAYSEWVGERLPMESEWEKSAIGELVSKRYVWGDEWIPPKNAGNFADEAAKKTFTGMITIDGYDDYYAYTAPIGSYNPNGYGLYDMAGNVWEWCDSINDNYYKSDNFYRYMRGGSFFNDADTDIGYFLRIAYRKILFSPSDSTTACYVGFRCVQDVPK